MRSFFLILSVLLLAGCSFTKPSMTEYRINLDDSTTNLTAGGCIDKSMKVSQAFSSTTLMTKDMSYAQGADKQFVYSQSQWSLDPNHAITSEILTLVREMRLFRSVQSSKSRSISSWVLEINIEDFMQYFNEDSTKSHVNTVISLTIINSKNSKVVSSKTFKSRVEVDSLDANGGVEALNRALLNTLVQSREWLAGVCI